MIALVAPCIDDVTIKEDRAWRKSQKKNGMLTIFIHSTVTSSFICSIVFLYCFSTAIKIVIKCCWESTMVWKKNFKYNTRWNCKDCPIFLCKFCMIVLICSFTVYPLLLFVFRYLTRLEVVIIQKNLSSFLWHDISLMRIQTSVYLLLTNVNLSQCAFHICSVMHISKEFLEEGKKNPLLMKQKVPSLVCIKEKYRDGVQQLLYNLVISVVQPDKALSVICQYLLTVYNAD